MKISKKRIREIVGLTFHKIGSNPAIWRDRALSFKEAAVLISKSKSSLPIPFYYNAGLSIELLLKAVAIAKEKEFKANHRLIDLCELNEIKITKDQEYTLELLSEHIIWSGRYPVPKKEDHWNRYHDTIQEKHIVRENNLTRADRNRFPTIENFLFLWELFEKEYASSIKREA